MPGAVSTLVWSFPTAQDRQSAYQVESSASAYAPGVETSPEVVPSVL